MRAIKHGIILNREELAALLAFTGDDTRFNVVQFRVNASGKLVASATDGKRAVEVVAQSDGAEVGEWGVDRTFLEACRRLLDKDQTEILLKVTSKGLRKAVVQGMESADERGSVSWPTEAATTQVSMDAVRELIGKAPRLEGSWFAVNPFYLQDLQVVAKACEKCPVTIYPPKDDKAPINFEACAATGRWRGVIMPVAVQGPGDEAIEEDNEAEDAERPGQPPKDPKKFELTTQLATEKKRRPKASKARKGKPPRARARAKRSKPEARA